MKVGPYELGSELGRGGFGVVYRAVAPDGRPVALKVLRAPDAPTRDRFAREVRLQRDLGQEAGFVPVLDSGDSPAGPWFVMPLLRESLEARLARGRLAVPEAVELARDLARALARAHARGIVHRDVKPQNVLFDDEGRPALADFGLAKHYRLDVDGASRSQDLSRSGQLRGTVGFMPQEQMADAAGVGPTADVFAFGAVLYEALAGRPAFTGPTDLEVLRAVTEGRIVPLAQLRADVPRWLAKLLERCLEAQGRLRPVDGASLLRELEAHAAEPLEPPRRRPRVAVAFAALVGLALAALVGAAAGGAFTAGSARPPSPAPSSTASPSASPRPSPTPTPRAPSPAASPARSPDAPPDAALEARIRELEAEVARVEKLGNSVARRPHARAYRDLGDACVRAGRKGDALDAYTRMLRLDSGNLEVQRTVLDLEIDVGLSERAWRRADYMSRVLGADSDADALLARARAVLEELRGRGVAPSPSAARLEGRTVVLFGFAGADAKVIETLASKVRQAFGLTVVVLEDAPVPDPQARGRGRSPGQLDIATLIPQARRTAETRLAEPGVLGVLGILAEDLSAPGANYVFGWGDYGTKAGVLSYARFAPGGRSFLVKRTVKQGLATVSYLLDLPRCSMPLCPCTYTNNVAEVDGKADVLCPECLESLARLSSGR